MKPHEQIGWKSMRCWIQLYGGQIFSGRCLQADPLIFELLTDCCHRIVRIAQAEIKKDGVIERE